MTELESLYAAVRTMPDDDTLRLALADHLDAMDTVSVPCTKCEGKGEVRYCDAAGDMDDEPCKACGGNLRGGYNRGTGFVADTSNRDRAELIRVQAELERYLGAGQTPPKRLEEREDTLLAANADRWRKGPVCEAAGRHHSDKCSGGRIQSPNAQFTQDCPHCFGTGDAGGLMREFALKVTRHHAGDYVNPVTYHRGMKRVECRAADVWEGAPPPFLDGGFAVYRPTPWALAVCRHHPDVVEMWLDLPFDMGRGWFVGSIPNEVWILVMGEYQTDDAARTALARAVVRWVHTFL